MVHSVFFGVWRVGRAWDWQKPGRGRVERVESVRAALLEEGQAGQRSSRDIFPCPLAPP